VQDAREKDGSYQFKLRGYPWTTMDGQDIVHARILTMHIIAKFEALGFELMTTIDMNEGIGDSGDSEFPMDRADGSRHLDLCVQDLVGRGYAATPVLCALRCRRVPWRGTLCEVSSAHARPAPVGGSGSILHRRAEIISASSLLSDFITCFTPPYLRDVTLAVQLEQWWFLQS
jgi:hypothetical protein